MHMLCTHSTARLPPALYVQVCACICTCGCRAYLYVRVPADMHTQCCVYMCTRMCACGYVCPLARVHAAVCRHAGVPLHVCVGPCARVCVAWISGMEAERAGVFVAALCVFPGKLFLTLAALQTASL